MKAALLTAPGRLEVKNDYPTPMCPPDGVLIRVMACGVCSADAKMLHSGHRALVYPRILGHEIAGRVVESRTPDAKPGDRVQIAPGMRCGVCRSCRRGADNQCEKREIFGFTRDGGFAEFLAVPLSGVPHGALQPLPEGLPWDLAALGEPVACCINAQERIGVYPEDAVLILGAGPLGLMHCAAARSRGAGTLLIADPLPDRRRNALAGWADHAFDPQSPDWLDRISSAVGGQGVDAIILAASGIAWDPKWVSLLAPQGRISVFSGSPPETAAFTGDLNGIHYREHLIAGAYGCTAAQNAAAISLIASGGFDFERLVTRRVSLTQCLEGLAHTRRREGYKSIVEVAHE